MKTTLYKALETRFNRRLIPRYTLKIQRVPIDLQGCCIIFVHHACIIFVRPCINFLHLYVYVFDF